MVRRRAPRRLGDARSPAEAIALLGRIRSLPGHTFWPDDVSPAATDASAFERVIGHRQVTDAHLLTLAARCGGALATFDRGVLDLVSDDSTAVELIG